MPLSYSLGIRSLRCVKKGASGEWAQDLSAAWVTMAGRVSNPDKPLFSSPEDASRCRAAVKLNRNPEGVSPSQLDWQIWLVGDRPTYLVASRWFGCLITARLGNRKYVKWSPRITECSGIVGLSRRAVGTAAPPTGESTYPQDIHGSMEGSARPSAPLSGLWGILNYLPLLRAC